MRRLTDGDRTYSLPPAGVPLRVHCRASSVISAWIGGRGFLGGSYPDPHDRVHPIGLKPDQAIRSNWWGGSDWVTWDEASDAYGLDKPWRRICECSARAGSRRTAATR